MNDDQLFVKANHPGAFCVFHQDLQKHKVYADRMTNVALSASFDSAGEAWADAARSLREKDERVDH